jgi:hypothetical protein
MGRKLQLGRFAICRSIAIATGIDAPARCGETVSRTKPDSVTEQRKNREEPNEANHCFAGA